MNLSDYKYVVGYGIGQYYDYIKKYIPDTFRLDYLCDARWKQIGKVYNGIPVISPEELRQKSNVFIVVFSGNPRNYQSICRMLDDMKMPYMHADKVLRLKKNINGKQLKKLETCFYEDDRKNRIIFQCDIEESISISFMGENNEVRIGAAVSVGKLTIQCGNNAYCNIGNGTEIEGCDIYVTDGQVIVGEECLLSTDVIIRNDDAHHIFDKNTGKRINYSGDIEIGNHVWIGQGVTLLSNACVGDNSIVGTRAVTSSQFPKEVIIAGSPAKIIRENVCWSKDNTNYIQRDNLRDCLAQEAYKYF